MAGNAVGDILRLVELLDRHFSAVGQPPEHPTWTFSVPCERDGDGWNLGRGGYFRSLLGSKHSGQLAEALKNIAPLAEVAVALNRANNSIASLSASPPHCHMRTMFDELLDTAWCESICRSTTHNYEHITLKNLRTRKFGEPDTEFFFGYGFKVISRQLLADMRNAASRLDDTAPWSEPKSPSEWVKIFDVSLTTLKRRIEAGTLRVQKINRKSWRVHKDDLPS